VTKVTQLATLAVEGIRLALRMATFLFPAVAILTI